MKITILAILTIFMISNSACNFSFGNAASVSDSTKETTKNQNNPNKERSAITSPQNTAGKTGTYRYKSGSYINAIGIEELGNDKLKVVLGANYEYKVDGEWMANSGSAEGAVTLKGNQAILVPEGFEGCQIKLDFFAANKIKVEQNGTDSDCGFGGSVNANGIYVKTSDDPNALEPDELPPTPNDGERINFERGQSSAVISGYVKQKQEVTYLVGAKAGQTMKVEITDACDECDVVFYVITPNGSRPMKDEYGEGYNSIWTGKLSETGDYQIVITTFESAKANFKMSVSIR